MILEKARILHSDLKEIVITSEAKLLKFKGSQICIFGGTGFVGKWLVSTLLEANEIMNLNLRINLFTRNIENAVKKLSIKSQDPVHFFENDFSSIENLKPIFSDFFVHGATSTVASTGSLDEEKNKTSTYNIARYIVDSAKYFMNSPKVVHLSSGAVYGPQSFNELNQFELQKSSIATPLNSYAHTKQITENLLNLESSNGLFSVSNPRLFAFAGPHISLVEHFAVGNFMHNALNNQDISVLGHPETVRTYLYPTDLINSILSLMCEPLSQEINLGSDKEITMLDLAKLISSLTTKTKIKVLGADQEPNRYAPPSLFQSGGVEVTVSLEEAIIRWYKWLTIQNESKVDS